MSNQQASLEAGRQAARERSVIGWGIFAWGIALVAVPLVYLRSPKMPTAALGGQDDGTDSTLFERAYVERLKTRQVKAVWVGVCFSIGTIILLSIPGGSNSSSSTGGFGPAAREAVESQRMVAGDDAVTAAEASTPRTSFGDGSYEVGVDIAPGTYRTSGPTAGSPFCSYARLRTAGASYTDPSQVLQLENVMGPSVVTIQPSDGGFFSQLCGTWSQR